MATTNINVRVDANLKQSAESLFAEYVYCNYHVS